MSLASARATCATDNWLSSPTLPRVVRSIMPRCEHIRPKFTAQFGPNSLGQSCYHYHFDIFKVYADGASAAQRSAAVAVAS